jgi:DNA ligase (NAD+)
MDHKIPPPEFKAIDQLKKQEAREQIAALREPIEDHDHLYYVKNEPEISDERYDQLFRRLPNLEEAFPHFQSGTSLTRRVGAEPVDQLARVEHTVPMLSLKAARDEDEVAEFYELVKWHAGGKQIVLIAEPKFDGVSIELVYSKGKFLRAATRGDGRIGEDISENVKSIAAVPMRLRNSTTTPGLLAVRGEVYVAKDDFREMNRRRIEQNEDPYTRPRNAVAAILSRLESREVASWPLDVVFSDVLQAQDLDLKTHSDELKHLEKWGLKVTYHTRRVESLDQVRKFHEQLGGGRDELPFEVDGIVIKVDDRRLQQQLGSRDRSPRWALVWKFPPRTEVTSWSKASSRSGARG